TDSLTGHSGSAVDCHGVAWYHAAAGASPSKPPRGEPRACPGREYGGRAVADRIKGRVRGLLGSPPQDDGYQQHEPPPMPPMPPMGPVDMTPGLPDPEAQRKALQVLTLAQRTADEHVASAQQQADNIRAAAKAAADQVAREAQAHSEQVRQDAAKAI